MPTFAERFDGFVFDLDGTLADTREDIAESVNRGLEAVGAPPLDVPTVTRYVGNGARVLVERALGPDPAAERVERALEVFLETYRARCVGSTALYPGVRETLEGLQDRKLAVLTNKPLYHSRRILDELEIAPLLHAVVGGDSFATRKPDPHGLWALCAELSVAAGRCLLVGDSSVDVLTARAGGTAAALVTYGFRPDSVEETPPDYLLADLRQLLGLAETREAG